TPPEWHKRFRAPASRSSWSRGSEPEYNCEVVRGRLFRKYVVIIVVLVSGALLTSGAIELYFSYRENQVALIGIQREKAIGAASKIEAFIRGIEHQIGWTTPPQPTA